MDQLEEMYRRHASAVFRFAWGLTGDRTTAEDLVSETFYRLITRAPKIRTQTALGYLLAIARNSWLNHKGRQRHHVPLAENLLAPEPDPDQRIDDRNRLAQVMHTLADLPEGERAALLLRADHDLSYEEIAAALDISPGAARVRVHRARARLYAALEPQGRIT